ncbi:MAG: PucR family transcriptional regulator [Synergistaceae bacterium]|jgi:hypothetical protein|nr:PucR family transcriptional regulator [Synergistaceae bacterium]
MYATIRDIINIDKLKSLKLIAGGKGLDNRVEKVGMLDYEFTKKGAPHNVETQWMPFDFVITTFLYAKENSELLIDAVKKLKSYGVSGIAVKNVFSLDIPAEVIRFANNNNFPFFIFTDNSLFFDDIIICVNNMVSQISDINVAEQKINVIRFGEHDKNQVKKLAREINYSFTDIFFCAYFRCRDPERQNRLGTTITAAASRVRDISGVSIVKYKDGFFYLVSEINVKKLAPEESVASLCKTLAVREGEYYIGISNIQFHLSDFRKALLQSIYAAEYCKITGDGRRAFRDLGIYQFLIPHADDEWLSDFYAAIVLPLIEHDTSRRGNILDFAMTYEMCYGNNREIARRHKIHDNTIRYRLKKIKSALGFAENDPSFEQQLLLALKLHRIKLAQDQNCQY